jgi:hypothetical protein
MDDGLFDLAAPAAPAPAGKGTDADAALRCPRCGGSLEGERFYGPCTACRDDLRIRIAGVATEVEVAAFEPALHVTPNAVATKD